MGNSYVAAVDLGTTKVVMAVACRTEDHKLEVVAIEELSSKGIIKGDLRNNEQAFLVLNEVKANIESRLGIEINEVFIGISGQHIKCTKSSGYVFVHSSDMSYSEVSAMDVARLNDDMYNISLPVGQTIVSVLPQSYKVDDETDIIEPVGIEGKRLEATFNLIIGEDAALDRITRCFARAEMRVAGILLQPLASANAVLSDDEMELGVAVIDIGGGTSDLCIYQDKIARHIAVLPIGGNDVNRDIKSYGILDRHLEKLKTKYGEAIAELAPDNSVRINSVSGQSHKDIPIKTLAGIIGARMEDIIDFVAKQIEKSGYKDRLGAGIVITGGSSVLKNLEKLFAAKFNCPVRVASPSSILTDESAQIVSQPKYSTLVGILMNAIDSGHDFGLEEQFMQIEAERAAQQVIEQAEVHVQQPVVQPVRNVGVNQGGNTATSNVTVEQPVRPVQSKPTKVIVDDALLPEEDEDIDTQVEDVVQEDDTTKRPGFFGKVKTIFKKRMFASDELQEEDEY